MFVFDVAGITEKMRRIWQPILHTKILIFVYTIPDD